MFRAEVISVPARDYGHDLDAMCRAIQPNTRLVFIANPNNPTGTMADGKALDRFMRHVPEHVVVCMDEAYIELLPPDRQPDTLQYVRAGRRIALLRTFSKTYGLAGLRIGYVIAPAECIRLLERVRQPFNVNAMAMAAAQAALDDEEYVGASRALVAEGLAYLEKELKSLGTPFVPAVTNFMLVEVGEGRKVFAALQREGVIVRPMDGYGLPRHVRITVGTRQENEKCIRALRAVLGRGSR
jgi:histidinol-phosphate aminotransferase